MGGGADEAGAPRPRSNLGPEGARDLLRARWPGPISIRGRSARPGLIEDGVRRAGAALEADPRCLRRGRRRRLLRDPPGRGPARRRHLRDVPGARRQPPALQHPLRPVATSCCSSSTTCDFIDIYHERIKVFHVKDAEFNPTGRQGVYSRLPALGQPRRPLPLAGRRPGRLRRHLLQARAVRLRRLGGARMGMLPQASRGRRARRRAVHRASTSSGSPRRRSTTSPAAASTMRGEPARCSGLTLRRRDDGAIEVTRRRDSRASRASASAWSAAARAPSSAPCIASPRGWTTDYELVAGALSSDAGAGAGIGRRARRSTPDAQLRRLRGDGQARGASDGRHRGGRDRHAQPHALRRRPRRSSTPAST